MKKVIVTGATGQTGSYMCKYLIQNTDNIVVAGVRRTSQAILNNLEDILDHPRFKIVTVDLCDPHAIKGLINSEKPDYFLNFGGQSFVKDSWDNPAAHMQTNAISLIHILESAREYVPDCRVYSAGCHDVETKAVTPDGIKDYKDIKVGDLVFSLNEETSFLELKPVKRVIEQDYDGDMLFFKGIGKNQLITPDHNIAIQCVKSGKIKYEKAIKAIERSLFMYPKAKWEGSLFDKEIDLKEFTKSSKEEEFRYIKLSDLFYLVGLFIGDGTTDISNKRVFIKEDQKENRCKKTGRFLPDKGDEKKILTEYICYRNFLHIPENDKSWNYIEEVLNRIGLKWSRDNRVSVYFTSEYLHKVFTQCGKGAKNKKIPKWMLKACPELLEKLLLGIQHSDGDKKGVISTISQKLKRDLIELIIKLGDIPSIYERPPRSATWSDGRVIKGNFNEVAVNRLIKNVFYRKKIKSVWCNKDTKPESKNYKGKIWCLEVEDNHNFLVYREGRVCFSGNSSEQFGDVKYSPQDESHPYSPRSVYGASKCAADHICKIYRESYDLFVIHGILFNHESPARQKYFISRKITTEVSRIHNEIMKGLDVNPLVVGNILAKRDWSHAKDFAKGVWLMMNQDKPKSYILSSNETRSVKDLIEICFKKVGIKLDWFLNDQKLTDEQVEKLNDEQMLDLEGRSDEAVLVKISKEFFRAAEVDILHGDSTKARQELGWKPEYTFEQLIDEMMEHDLKNV